MAESDVPAATGGADEIAALRQQMDAMQKRLDELLAANAGASFAKEGEGAESASAVPSASGGEAAEAAAFSSSAASGAPGPDVREAAPAPVSPPDPVIVVEPAVAEPEAEPAVTEPEAEPVVQPSSERETWGEGPYARKAGQAPYQQPYGSSWGRQAHTQPQPVYAPYQAPVVRTKDHVAAGLLAVFLGAFGIHKFYLGYNAAGFVLLAVSILGGIFTLGIASSVVWLIGVIEGIIYLSKSQQEFERLYVANKHEWF